MTCVCVQAGVGTQPVDRYVTFAMLRCVNRFITPPHRFPAHVLRTSEKGRVYDTIPLYYTPSVDILLCFLESLLFWFWRVEWSKGPNNMELCYQLRGFDQERCTCAKAPAVITEG